MRVLNILALTRYGRLGASSRVRTHQYLEYLRANGCEVNAAPLFDDAYLQALYHGGRRPISTLWRGYVRRIRQLLGAGGYDLLWLEKEVLPWLPYALEKSMLPASVPYVVDFDDAVFHRYDLHRSAIVRRVLGTKLGRIMARAQAVVAGSHYLAAYARDAGARRVELLPTAVDLEHYPVRAVQPAGRRIGWIGTPLTARQYLPIVYPALLRLARERDYTLVVIGAGEINLAGLRVECHEWSAETEAGLIGTLDMGIMPLNDGPWERGKCGYKLIQYMACAVPVVASDVGENPYIVHHGEHGFLARSEADWVEALGSLLDDPQRARAMGLAGRRRVEAQYSTRATAPRLLDILRQAASGA